MILRGLESAANGMLSLIEMHDNIANNLANVNTTGYKRTALTFKNIMDANVYENKGTLLDGETRNLGDLSMGSTVQKLTYDFSQGTLMRTDNPYDLAIEGDGFFKVQDPATNEVSYTRNGSFTLDKSNFIMTKEGGYLLDQNDQPIRINLSELDMYNSNQFTVTEQGQIEINGRYGKTQMEQRIAIYDFQDKDMMFNIGGSKFVSKDMEANPPVPAEKFVIQQGHLEASNANVIREMLNTINTSRNYESLTKIVKTNNSLLSAALSVGKIKV
ncbi:flagellar hook basal-body protein [bacterium]|nr:flagellar hook basal-body protein [bacterium]